jgi:hypothetical protein
MRYLRGALSAVLFAGCVAPEESEISPEGKSWEGVGTATCSPNVCGSSLPSTLECTYFWTLHSGGLANDLGIRIVAVHRADGREMLLTPRPDHLVGVDPVTGLKLAEHAELEGTVIVVTDNVTTRTITIRHVALADEHFMVGSQAAVEAYDVAYTPPSGVGPELQKRVIAYGGSVVDPVTKRITEGASSEGWINFACKGSTLYRQHLLGHTAAAQLRLGIPITLAKEQAVLNSLTMNACGTGRTWSKDAEPITLSESQHLLPPTSPYQAAPVSFEAIWTADRAVCVNIPRLATNASMVTETLSWMAIECGAPMPACTSAMLDDWTAHGDVVTGNPAGSSP